MLPRQHQHLDHNNNDSSKALMHQPLTTAVSMVTSGGHLVSPQQSVSASKMSVWQQRNDDDHIYNSDDGHGDESMMKSRKQTLQRISTTVLMLMIIYIFASMDGVVAGCPTPTLRVVVPRGTSSIVATYSVTRLTEQLQNTVIYGFGACPLNITEYTSELSISSINGDAVVYDNNNNIVNNNNGGVPYDIAIVPPLTAYALRHSPNHGNAGTNIYQILSLVRPWGLSVTAYTG
jgi:hypothetical protein